MNLSWILPWLHVKLQKLIKHELEENRHILLVNWSLTWVRGRRSSQGLRFSDTYLWQGRGFTSNCAITSRLSSYLCMIRQCWNWWLVDWCIKQSLAVVSRHANRLHKHKTIWNKTHLCITQYSSYTAD